MVGVRHSFSFVNYYDKYSWVILSIFAYYVHFAPWDFWNPYFENLLFWQLSWMVFIKGIEYYIDDAKDMKRIGYPNDSCII